MRLIFCTAFAITIQLITFIINTPPITSIAALIRIFPNDSLSATTPITIPIKTLVSRRVDTIAIELLRIA